MAACCVSGCKNRYNVNSSVKFYRIPTGSRPYQANRRRLWLQAIQQANGDSEELKDHARICGAHFISGELSMDLNMPDYVPSVFTCTKQSQRQSPKTKVKRVYHRRQRLHRSAKTKAKDKMTPPGADSPEDLQPSGSMETESELLKETLASSTPLELKEEEILTTGAESETETKTVQLQTTSSLRKTLLSVKTPAGVLQLDIRNPIVLLKRLVLPAGGYHCEQTVTNISQLTEHEQQHEEQQPFMCDTCGKCVTGQADFTHHQLVHTEECESDLPDRTEESTFPCNMCDRTFPTSHHLKRHKLLHVKDGRKCLQCGTLFCRRHNHVVYLPQPECKAESDEDFTITEQQDLGNDSISENDSPDEQEPSQTAEMADDVQSLPTVTPLVTSSASSSPPVPEFLHKTHQASAPVSYTRPLSKIFAPVSQKPPPMPHPPSQKHSYSMKSDPLFYLSPVPKYPPVFVRPHQPENVELPPSLNMFSPQYLTSALFEVKRNYEYILSRPRKSLIKNIVKKEEVKPLIFSDVQSVTQEKKERVAYDLEIVL